MKKSNLVLLLIIFIFSSSSSENFRNYISLTGKWQFAVDTANVGIQQKWYLTNLNDSISLPGTTDLSKKGFINKDTTTLHLSRIYKYEGAAWFRKKVNIPEDFRNKHILLFLERTKSTTIWIDNILIGGSRILQSPQQFDVTDHLTPGDHYITIRVDNDLKNTPYGNVHIYSDDTQTNWNGIIGKIFLEASSKTHITNLHIYPDVDKKNIRIKVEIDNRLKFKEADIEILVERNLDGKIRKLQSQKTKRTVEPIIELEYYLGEECSLWDEYKTPIYSLTAVISNGKMKDSKTVTFGMRKYTTKGTQFEINGRTIFLRGKHEAAVFPLTGHTPMDVESWERVYKIAKSYGINHYRFHSYCPPEAAFIAADQVGIYLQVELPFWGGLDSDSVAEMLKDEGFAMLKTYANHPSFVMFSHGNEIWSGHDRVEKNIIAFKELDNRPLFTMGSNNNIGYVPPRKCSDFFVGARTPYSFDTILTHTRLSHCFADSKDGGILNTQTPSTNINFDYAVSQMNIPVISHEVGQYQIYPNYDEINKYTGVLRALNLEVFSNRLVNSGMSDQNIDFQKASGAWSALCYKAEIEAALRTKGLAGFQLLDLQDFPGQGTALVGILDAFMESKDVVTREEWRRSCNDVVILLDFQKYCWNNKEKFRSKVLVANYSNQSIDKELTWEIKNQKGDVIQNGKFFNLYIEKGKLNSIGEIEVNLSFINKSEKLNLYLSIPHTSYNNQYPIWVYTFPNKIIIPNDIIVTETLNDEMFEKLQNGAKVLFFPKTKDIDGKSFLGLFPPEFWNYGMFKGISEWAKKPISPGTLGILTNPNHPIFNLFPTDYHTNWQWFSIIKASNSFILDSTSKEYKPIVQVIDNLERNHKLGLIFEFKIGRGKILVCMSQLNQISERPEAIALYQSILAYMDSDNFNPNYEINRDRLIRFFTN